MIRRYSELVKLKTFKERYEYLRVRSAIGESTFGFERFLNQACYTSKRWRAVRDKVSVRDNGCDLGVEGHDIYDRIIIHHMNPLTREQLRDPDDSIFDPEFLICVCDLTHRAIHYGDESLLPKEPVIRKPYDTCPWKG